MVASGEVGPGGPESPAEQATAVLTGRVCHVRRFGKKLTICAVQVLHIDDSSWSPGLQVDCFFEGDAARTALRCTRGAAFDADKRGVVPEMLRCKVWHAVNARGTAVLHCLQLLGLRADIGPLAAIAGARAQETRAPKSERHAVFADWLVTTFGIEALSEGTGVLDVAGGAGRLSVELLRRGVERVTLIEPDPSGDRHGFADRGTRLSERTGCMGKTSSALAIESAIQAEFGSSFRLLAAPFSADLFEQHAEVLAGCSLVVGLHPDQATEPLVDWAATHRKRFAVVPCCVFPNLFRERCQFWRGCGEGSADSRPGLVRGYPTFLRYLAELAAMLSGLPVEKAALPIDGRNRVLFSRGAP